MRGDRTPGFFENKSMSLRMHFKPIFDYFVLSLVEHEKKTRCQVQNTTTPVVLELSEQLFNSKDVIMNSTDNLSSKNI